MEIEIKDVKPEFRIQLLKEEIQSDTSSNSSYKWIIVIAAFLAGGLLVAVYVNEQNKKRSRK